MPTSLTQEKAIQALDELAEHAFWSINNQIEKPDLWINARYYPLLKLIETFFEDREQQ